MLAAIIDLSSATGLTVHQPRIARNQVKGVRGFEIHDRELFLYNVRHADSFQSIDHFSIDPYGSVAACPKATVV